MVRKANRSSAGDSGAPDRLGKLRKHVRPSQRTCIKYSGADLRRLRSERGVGKMPR
jgi:hypothetical protein